MSDSFMTITILWVGIRERKDLTHKQKKKTEKGLLGGSVVERLLLAQGVILVPGSSPIQPPCKESASPSAYVSTSLSVSPMNK